VDDTVYLCYQAVLRIEIVKLGACAARARLQVVAPTAFGFLPQLTRAVLKYAAEAIHRTVYRRAWRARTGAV
jgi:hypothetical protein